MSTTSEAATTDVAKYLDETLDVGAFDDTSHNGLQVANAGRVTRVCCGVDASMAFFEAAAERGANLLVCHHGLSWGDSLKRITGMNYARLAFLMRHDMALYAAHLPLDAHARYGNNILICKALGLRNVRPFGRYRDQTIGFAGELPSRTRYAVFKERVRRCIGRDLRAMEFGPERVRRIAVISGGASAELDQAAAAGMDVYITGEPQLSAYAVAQECGLHALFAGHYATEVFGVRKLAEVLRRRFKVPAEFIALDIPF